MQEPVDRGAGRVAVGGQHEEPGPVDLPAEVLEQSQRRLVRPVQVLQDDDQSLGLGRRHEGLDGLDHEPEACRGGVALVLARPVGEQRTQGG